MAKSVNKVILLGNVGHSPEIKITNGAGIVATFSLATTDRYQDQSGNWVDRTEWHSLVAFKRTAEIVRDYVTHGSKLYIEGKLQTQSWDDKQSGQKRYRTQIIVHDISLLSARDGGDNSTTNQRKDPARAGNATEYAQAMGDQNPDVPF
jgi:single-strand DNA-binding protein